MKPTILKYCQSLEQEFDAIPSQQKEKLLLLSNYIQQKIQQKQIVNLIVVCTHNSRRSHIGQLWLAVAADYYKIPNVQTFSGGTESTTFNLRAVQAFERIGFGVDCDNVSSSNPFYYIKWSDTMSPYIAFSKKYDDFPNPSQNFAAIMVCTQADEGCPMVLGCDFRLSLPYEDPKNYDDSALETTKYDERCREIGRELFWVMSNIKVD